MHSVLSMVRSMVTPTDLKRMLAKAVENHAQKPVQSHITPRDVAQQIRNSTRENNSTPRVETVENIVISTLFEEVTVQDSVAESQEIALPKPLEQDPSPALMPPRRTSTFPTSFASLNSRDLPIVREYSAGGLVFDTFGRVAIIARHSRSGHLEWCLPKGHIEKGETPSQTAVREIHEETGILGEVVDSIATIDYWFTGTSQRIHKLVHHYALRYVSGELSVLGDPDHEAEDALWVHFDELGNVLSYPNERKIVWMYAKKIKKIHRRFSL